MAIDNRPWVPTGDFLSAKFADWHDKDGHTHKIEWHFSKISTSYFPVQIYECRISGFGFTASGYGTSSVADDALIKSFAEAWERLWFIRLRRIDENFKGIFSSNGFASGSSNNMALENARQELIERSVLLKAWQSKSGWKKTRSGKLRHKFILFALGLLGWRVNFFSLSHSPEVSAILGRHQEKGAVFDTSFDSNNACVHEKLLNSLIKSIALRIDIPSNYTLPVNGDPDDHNYFYCDPKNLAAFDFLDTAQRDQEEANISLSDFDKIVSTLLVPSSNFPAVAFAFHPEWPVLDWGQSSIHGENQWPHPLA